MKKVPNNKKNATASNGKAGQHRQIKSTQIKISKDWETSEDDHPPQATTIRQEITVGDPGKKKRSQGSGSKWKREDDADDQDAKRHRGPSKRDIIQGYRIFCLSL